MLSRSVSTAVAIAALAFSPLTIADDQTSYVDSLSNLITTDDPFDPAIDLLVDRLAVRLGPGAITMPRPRASARSRCTIIESASTGSSFTRMDIFTRLL